MRKFLRIGAYVRAGVACTIVGGLGACAEASDGSFGGEDEELVQTSSPILAERPGEVEYAYRYYSDPNIAKVAFASPSFNGCSATMIGPNFVLTAAHCGPAEADPNQTATLRFRTYRANETELNSETFSCKRLLHGWPRHDLALAFCTPNAAGVNPGDKYGYLDFETRAPQVGDRVYSVWWNTVDQGATGGTSVPLFSAGSVVSTTAKIWSGILGAPAGTNVGILMNTWAQPGASGSSNVDANTHRILVGPTSLANTPESAARWAFSMNTYLDTTVLAPGTYPGAGFIENVTARNFPPGPFNPNDYVGNVDHDDNAVFDVQQDIERYRGENQRASYWLALDNRRRNALWERGLVLLDYDAKEVPVTFVGSGLVLQHRLLNLKPNTSYRVGVVVKTNSAGSSSALTVGFERSGVPAWSTAPLQTTPGTTVLRTAMLRTDANPKPFFAIRTSGAFNGSVREIQLIEEGSTSSFELADQREGYTTSSGPATFLPRGVTSETGSAPDFALAIRPSLWTLRAVPVSTQKLLFLTSHAQRLCFKARTLAATSALGTAVVTSGTTTALNATFPLSTTLTQHCISRIRTPDTNSRLTFSASGSILTNILIDDVRVDIDPTAPPIVLPPIRGGVFQP